MEIYRVGGAVRDKIIGWESIDNDYVVVGATPEDLTNMGMTQVGADFPVFLDSEGNEYALARTERKIGVGYNGFDTRFGPEVTLRQDLARRDFTMNSIAENLDTGEIIDYYDGVEDLEMGIIRHVSEAFAEDPLRVLRAARFAARYNFTIAPETIDMMVTMVDHGEVKHLTPERVWKEVSRAMMETFPERFFDTLDEVGALEDIFGKASIAFLTIEKRLTEMARNLLNEEQRWMGVFYDTGEDISEAFITKLPVPNNITKAIMLAQAAHKIDENDVDSVMEFAKLNRMWTINQIDTLYEFDEVLDVCMHDIRFDRVIRGFREGMEVGFDSLTEEQRNTLQGPEIGRAIEAMRRVIVAENLA